MDFEYCSLFRQKTIIKTSAKKVQKQENWGKLRVRALMWT